MAKLEMPLPDYVLPTVSNDVCTNRFFEFAYAR